jgi:hypothetical protein
VEWVHAPDSVRAPPDDCGGERFGHVARHQLELPAAFFAEQLQELLDCRSVTAWGDPHEPAAVVVHDDGQVPVAASMREVIDPDPLQAGEQVAVGDRLLRDPLADRSDGPPRDAHQLRYRLLGRVDRQPAALILERDGEPAVMPGPRDRRHDHPVRLTTGPMSIEIDRRGQTVEALADGQARRRALLPLNCSRTPAF